MTDTPADVVVVERSERVLLVTLNRPDARNAVNRAVADAVEAAMDELDRDPALGVAVISGNGSAFCAGMDLKAFARGELPRTPRRGFAGVTALPPEKPLIAAVEGPAFGGGFEVVLACDLVVASETARFGLPEVRRGLIASGGGLIRLPRLIPPTRAMEILLTGNPIEAAEAYSLGLVNRLVEPGKATAVALELAHAITANAPLAVAAIKRVVREGADWPMDAAFARQEKIAAPVIASNDAREGALAFAEKRAPRWSGT
jgi:enoyl-CoA hydratase